MKFSGNNNAVKCRSILLMLPVLSLLSLAACAEQEPVKSVDLRFLAEDEYMVEATDAEPIILYVSSTDSWTVYSENPDWCSITPSEGEAGVLSEPYAVTVAYFDNPSLDERIDTLTIQSDYWIGKQIRVIQNGTAYMNLTPSEIPVSKEGISSTIKVETNHVWRAEVVEGSEWLTLQGVTSGDGDGSISYTVSPNTGERRSGTINVYDHNDEICRTVPVTQDGIQLDPDVMLVKASWETDRYVLHVEANAGWTVTKDDETLSWYSFDKQSFEGSGDLTISFEENTGAKMRTATFTVSSVSGDDGATPVRKQITVKQACPFMPEMVEFTQDEINASWVLWGAGYSSNGDDLIMTKSARLAIRNDELGYYSFKVKSMKPDAIFRIEVLFNNEGWKVLSHWGCEATTGLTFSNSGGLSNAIERIELDCSQPHEFSWYFAPNDDNYMFIDYMLDGRSAGIFTFDGSEGGVVIKYPLEHDITVIIGATAGADEDAVVVDSWGHMPLIEWGN